MSMILNVEVSFAGMEQLGARYVADLPLKKRWQDPRVERAIAPRVAARR